MSAPQLLPMLKPFAQAIAAQRERVPMSDAAARKLDSAAALRAWWISSLTKDSLAKEAYREAMAAIDLGLTKDEFLERLGTVLDKNGGTLLSPQRLELIAQNNHAVAYAAGRYAQMRDPDITAARPFWQYPLGPNDSRTSEICRKLEGFVAHHTHPAWGHIFPPNHHGERHLQVLTLTEEQAIEAGIYSDDGPEYPMVEGQAQLPDPGWDMRPDLLAADDAAIARMGNELSESALIGAKTPADYGLVPMSSIDVAALPKMPPAADYRSLFAIPDGQKATWYATPLGSARVQAAAFEQLGAAATELAPAIRSTLDDPLEAWWLYDAEGRTEFRLFGIFAGDAGSPPLRVVARIGADGRLTWSIDDGNDWTSVEAARRGRLIRSSARSAS